MVAGTPRADPRGCPRAGTTASGVASPRRSHSRIRGADAGSRGDALGHRRHLGADADDQRRSWPPAVDAAAGPPCGAAAVRGDRWRRRARPRSAPRQVVRRADRGASRNRARACGAGPRHTASRARRRRADPARAGCARRHGAGSVDDARRQARLRSGGRRDPAPAAGVPPRSVHAGGGAAGPRGAAGTAEGNPAIAHSSRSVVAGSTRRARHAGGTLASTAIDRSSPTVGSSDVGASAETPKSVARAT